MILVTGATGTNGRELIRELLAAGEEVRAGVRNDPSAESAARKPGDEGRASIDAV